MVRAASRWYMTTSTPTSELSHGSSVSPRAKPRSSRDRTGMMCGKVVLDRTLDSVDQERFELELDYEYTLAFIECKLRHVKRDLTFAIVHIFQKRFEFLLVQNSALCVSLPQRHPRLLQTGNLKDYNSMCIQVIRCFFDD